LGILGCLLVASAPAEELLRNGDFAAGKSKWEIEGKCEPAPGPPPALRVLLDKKKWTLLEQELDLPKEAARTITVAVALEASPDFKPEEVS
jgi:hypothetical protein